MNALVIYESQFGNTAHIAEAIGNALKVAGNVRVIRVAPVGRTDAVLPDAEADLAGVDVLLVGSPTQGWRPTPAVRDAIRRLPAERLRGMAAATFDTRFCKPRWLTGSAAVVLARQLTGAGCTLIAPPESFFVDRSEGPLLDGEVERAASWASRLLARVGVWHATHRV